MRTKKQQRWGLRASNVLALFAYLGVLFYSQIHLALEEHEHGHEASHAAEHDHEHDGDEHHAPHSSADHQIADATPCLGKAEQFVLRDLVTVAILILTPKEPAFSANGWSKDIPKHPPPRLQEQPRSPPVA